MLATKRSTEHAVKRQESIRKKGNEQARLVTIMLATKSQECLELEKERASKRKVRQEVSHKPRMQDPNYKNASTD